MVLITLFDALCEVDPDRCHLVANLLDRHVYRVNVPKCLSVFTFTFILVLFLIFISVSFYI